MTFFHKIMVLEKIFFFQMHNTILQVPAHLLLKRPAPAHTSTPFFNFSYCPPLGEIIKIYSPPLKEGGWRYELWLHNMFHVFRSNHHCSWKFHKFQRKAPVLESVFFLKIINLYKDICFAWISRTFAKNCSL